MTLLQKILAPRAIKYRFLIILINIFGYLLIRPFTFIGCLLRKNKTPKRIAVMRADQIGDMILTTPVFESIKKDYPKTKLHVICNKIMSKTVANDPTVDKVEIFQPAFWFTRGNKSSLEMWKFVFRNFRKYDVLFEMRGDPMMIFISFFLAKQRIGFSDWGFGFLLSQAVEWKTGEHRVWNNLELVKALSGIHNDCDQRIFVNSSKKVDEIIEKSKGKIIIISPFAGEIQRNFPDRLLKELIGELSKSDNTILLTGGPSDFEALEKLRPNKKNVLNLSKELKLDEFFYLVKKSDLLICSDSAPAHVAAAFKIPEICLYAFRKEKAFYPYNNPKAHVILKHYKCKNMVGERCPKSDCEVHMKRFKTKEIIEETRKWL